MLCIILLNQLLMAILTIILLQGNTISEVDSCSSQGTASTSQSNESTLKYKGYQPTLVCTTSTNMPVEDKLVKIEQSGEQQITAMELELKLHQNLIEKYKNELTDDEGYEGKGKGGKGYVQKVCNSEEDLKEQYLSKIKNDKKYSRFQQLDNETQLMISKIDVFRGLGSGNGFFDELLELFEGKSMELMEMKELESKYVKAIDELQEQLEEKDQENDDLKKKLQAALMGKTREHCLSEMSRIKGRKMNLKIEELDEESQLMIAHIEALRESDDQIYNKVLSMTKFDDDQYCSQANSSMWN